MIVADHITCDICSEPKGTTNGWLVGITVACHSGVMYVPAQNLVIDRNSVGVNFADLCGQACAAKHFSQCFDNVLIAKH